MAKSNQVKRTVPQQAGMLRATQRVSHYSGPLPQSEELARYNEIIPNAAERILKMAENEQQHRFDVDSKQLAAQTLNDENVYKQNLKLLETAHRSDVLRICGASFTCLVIIVAGIATIFKGYPTQGASIICTTVVGIIASYLGKSLKKESTTE